MIYMHLIIGIWITWGKKKKLQHLSYKFSKVQILFYFFSIFFYGKFKIKYKSLKKLKDRCCMPYRQIKASMNQLKVNVHGSNLRPLD
jgi:hypothetical protein